MWLLDVLQASRLYCLINKLWKHGIWNFLPWEIFWKMVKTFYSYNSKYIVQESLSFLNKLNNEFSSLVHSAKEKAVDYMLNSQSRLVEDIVSKFLNLKLKTTYMIKTLVRASCIKITLQIYISHGMLISVWRSL